MYMKAIVAGTSVTIGVPGAINASFDANKALEAEGRMSAAQAEARVPRSAYHASFKALQEAFEDFAGPKGKRRIVVFIDDLDRCLPGSALQVLESMKLFFDLPGFVLNPYAYMARAAVLAVSSAHEGFCNVLVEAMACGCPVVSTDCPSGPAEILDGGRFGRLVPVGDDRALAPAIAGTLDAPRDPDRLRMRARFFSLDRAVEHYERLLLGDGPLEQLSPMPRTRIVEPGSLPWRKGVPSAGGPV